MENKTNADVAAEIKSATDTAINTKATEVAENAATALEAKATEINDIVVKNNEEATANAEKLQKQIDTMKEEQKNFAIGTPKVSASEQYLQEKADEIKNIKTTGKSVTLDLKTLTTSAGADSAPYGDNRVEMIKYDPNFDNRVRNHVLTGSTGNDGAVRHTFEASYTNLPAAKTKGAAGSAANITLNDVHTPIQTIFQVFTLPQEQLNDIAMIDSYLRTRLVGQLMDVEDVQILRGDGTTPNYNGIATGGQDLSTQALIETYVGTTFADTYGTAANRYDALTAAAAGLAANNYVADKVFLNPLDYYRMTTIKSTQNEYVLAQTVAPDGSYKTFWNGIEVVKTAAQTAGAFIMIDSKKANQYWIREGASIEFGYNDTDFANNNISVRAKLRGANTNYLAKGIVSATFANFALALNT